METTTTSPLGLDEIINNISSKNMTGRNSLGRGIRGDIEEYLGWHENNLKDSPLTQQDRIKTLKQITSSEHMMSDAMIGSDLKKFVDDKIVELMIDEADVYLSERNTLPKSNESKEIETISNSINNLELELSSSTDNHIKVEYEGYTKEEQSKRDELHRNIKEQKINLYKLVFEPSL